MFRTMLTAKIHRATVTQADLHYVGSITVDADLLDASGILSGEQVHVVDITNGARLETYAIPGERGSGVIGINGAAAHLVSPGDLVIVMAYGVMEDAEARRHEPTVVHVDAGNRVVALGADPAEPVPGTRDVRGDTVGEADPVGAADPTVPADAAGAVDTAAPADTRAPGPRVLTAR